MGIWVARHPPPYLKSRALRGGFLKSWASQGRILYPKPWILQGGFFREAKWDTVEFRAISPPPLVPQPALEKGGGYGSVWELPAELRLGQGWPRAWPGLAWPGLAQPVKMLHFPKVLLLFGHKYPKKIPARFARRNASFS